MTADYDIPKGWARAAIRELLQINYGKGLKESERVAGDVPVYGSNGLVGTHDRAITQSPVVIVGRKGTVGAIHYSPIPVWPIDTTYFVHGFAAVDAQFAARLFTLLNLKGLDTSTAVPGLNRDDVYRQIVAVPPLAEQRRIVAAVEELLAHVGPARERLNRAASLLKRFRRSVVEAACSGQLTRAHSEEGLTTNGKLPSGWQWKQLDGLVPRGGIFDGPFGSNLKTADYTSSGVRVVRLENIAQLRFLNNKHSYISRSKYATLKKHTVAAGDIIFASFAEDEVRACVLPPLSTKAIAKADCFCVRPQESSVLPRYLVLQLVTRASHDALRESIHGATRPRVNVSQLRRLSVRVCPVGEQQEIVSRVDALFALADAVEERIAAASERAEKLTQSLLAKAFRGELVPTEAELARREGRDYEPASVLLGRIRAERQTAPAARRRRAR